MKIMNLFKRKSRRQLIEENRKLRFKIYVLENIQKLHSIESNGKIREVCSNCYVRRDSDIQEERVFKKLYEEIFDKIRPVIEVEVTRTVGGGDWYRGILYVATGGKQ